MGRIAEIVVALCRMSYYVNLLGLKIPFGLLVRASRAPHVLAVLSCVWVPFLIYCHVSLIPAVRESTYGFAVWHTLTAMWLTIPLLVVGSVILSFVRARKPLQCFLAALAVVVSFHVFAIPALMHRLAGTVLLQVFFALFEDAPIIAWIWCLVHVVRTQNHMHQRQASKQNPIEECKQGEKVLIVGNAPTVMELPLGEVMDSFQHVCRFNSYHVGKPEYTGSKVGFHFCNGRSSSSAPGVKVICPLFNASLTHAAYLFMPNMENAGEIYDSLTSQTVDAWFIAEEQIMELRKKLGCRVWQIPTSGMVALNAFLSADRADRQVALHGFNFFAGKQIHYFEESPTQLITSWLERFVTHDPSLEKVWVASLMREGRTCFLADSVKPASEQTKTQLSGDAAMKTNIAESARPISLRKRGLSLKDMLKDALPSQLPL